jgi:hypothetical protein
MRAMATNGDGAVRRDQTSDLQLLVHSAPSLIHTSRPDGYLDFFNQRRLTNVGRLLADLQGWNWTEFIQPVDGQRMVEKWRACLAGGEPFLHEARSAHRRAIIAICCTTKQQGAAKLLSRRGRVSIRRVASGRKAKSAKKKQSFSRFWTSRRSTWLRLRLWEGHSTPTAQHLGILVSISISGGARFSLLGSTGANRIRPACARMVSDLRQRWGRSFVDLSQLLLELLRTDEEFVLHRGEYSNHPGSPSVLLAPASMQPAMESYQRSVVCAVPDDCSSLSAAYG